MVSSAAAMLLAAVAVMVATVEAFPVTAVSLAMAVAVAWFGTAMASSVIPFVLAVSLYADVWNSRTGTASAGDAGGISVGAAHLAESSWLVLFSFCAE